MIGLTATRERLTSPQISVLRSLFQRGAALRPITLAAWQRLCALALWRREIVEIWYRQAPEELQGPYYGLTISGAQLAAKFVHPAPRGSSGAEPEPS